MLKTRTPKRMPRLVAQWRRSGRLLDPQAGGRARRDTHLVGLRFIPVIDPNISGTSDFVYEVVR